MKSTVTEHIRLIDFRQKCLQIKKKIKTLGWETWYIYIKKITNTVVGQINLCGYLMVRPDGCISLILARIHTRQRTLTDSQPVHKATFFAWRIDLRCGRTSSLHYRVQFGSVWKSHLHQSGSCCAFCTRAGMILVHISAAVGVPRGNVIGEVVENEIWTAGIGNFFWIRCACMLRNRAHTRCTILHPGGRRSQWLNVAHEN